MKHLIKSLQNSVLLICVALLLASCYAQNSMSTGGGGEPGENPGQITDPIGYLGDTGEVTIAWNPVANPARTSPADAMINHYCVDYTATTWFGPSESYSTVLTNNVFVSETSVNIPFNYYYDSRGQSIFLNRIVVVAYIRAAVFSAGAYSCSGDSSGALRWEFTNFYIPGPGSPGPACTSTSTI